MKAVKAFFKKIWDFISSNAWIQPLLFVGAIFIIILALEGFGHVISNADFRCSKKDDGKYVREILMVDLMDKINNDESFVLFIGKTDCEGCQKFIPVLKEYHRDYKNDIVYYLNLDLNEDSTYKDTTNSRDKMDDLWRMISKDSNDRVTPTVVLFMNGEVEEFKAGGGIYGINYTDIKELFDKIKQAPAQ